MSKTTVPIPCGTAVVIANEIEARENAFQLIVSGEHKPNHLFVEFELWEDGNPLPHTIRLNADGTWKMTTEIVI